MQQKDLALEALHVQSLEIGDDATAFRTLNEEWIERHFTLEKHDAEILNDPENFILRAGGKVFLAYLDDAPVACVALIPTGNDVYELSKMAVAPALRGRGLGRWLLHHAICEAERLGARKLFLGSSKKLPAAVHLYEAAGFRHVDPAQLPELPYTRADVHMALDLNPMGR